MLLVTSGSTLTEYPPTRIPPFSKSIFRIKLLTWASFHAQMTLDIRGAITELKAANYAINAIEKSEQANPLTPEYQLISDNIDWKKVIAEVDEPDFDVLYGRLRHLDSLRDLIIQTEGEEKIELIKRYKSVISEISKETN